MPTKSGEPFRCLFAHHSMARSTHQLRAAITRAAAATVTAPHTQRGGPRSQRKMRWLVQRTDAVNGPRNGVRRAHGDTAENRGGPSVAAAPVPAQKPSTAAA